MGKFTIVLPVIVVSEAAIVFAVVCVTGLPEHQVKKAAGEKVLK